MKNTKRGRPKGFDEHEALEKAMLLFWKNGYIATSIKDLTQALGITAPSLYCSFGDKASLFNQCIDYYLAHEACPTQLIMQQAKTAKIAFEILMYDSAKNLVQPDKPMGCMLITSAMGSSKQVQEVQNAVQEKRQYYKTTLVQRLEQGIVDGDVPKDVPINTVVDFYTTIINGLSIQACDGANLASLNQVIFNAMKIWDSFIPPKNNPENPL